ncbi:MAG: AI-2E family transporter [Anaerolineae bacterium]|nr:AI-2E family transporter [Anaerolineae bacterium]
MTAGQAFRNTVIVLATLVGAYILFVSARILVVLVIAVFIASAIRPFVLRLVSWRIPAGAAILITYVLLTVGILALFLVVIPPIVNQAADYLQNEWRLASRIIYSKDWLERTLTNITGNPVALVDDDQVRAVVTDFVDQMRGVVPHMLTDLGGVVAEAVLAIVMGVYWLTSRDKAVQFILALFPHRNREEIGEIITKIESSVGNYIAGMVMVASFVGLVNFAILSVLRIPNAAAVGFIVGTSTMLPIVGGFIGGGLATLLALLTSPLNAVIVFIVFVAVQQVENHYLTPRTMARSVGIDPLLVMVAVFAGFALGGVIGGIIAVPITGAISILMRHLIFEPRKASVEYTVENDGAILIPSSDAPPPPTSPKVPPSAQGSASTSSPTLTS